MRDIFERNLIPRKTHANSLSVNTFNLSELIQNHQNQNLSLTQSFINPQFAKVLQTISFDKSYSKGSGSILEDTAGTEYLDLLAGFGVFTVGRNHPVLKQTLHDAIDMDLPNMVQMDAPLLAGLLAEKLISLTKHHGLDTVFFNNSGTEAVETALKFARCATGRSRVLFLDHAYHGLSLGSLSVNGNSEFRDGFGDLLQGCEKIPFNDLDALKNELKKEDVAAFIFEPIQGKGVFIPEDHFLPEAEKLCRQHGTLLIADEVQTGFGRTGKWFGFEHWGIQPDIITVSKALSGGMVPVGATIYRREIYNKVFSRMDRCVVHSTTFGRNALAMVCGLATLHIIESENLVERAASHGHQMVKNLQALMPRHEWMKEVRGKGLLIGVEFQKPKSFLNKLKWNMIHQMDKGLFGELIVIPLMTKHRIITQVSGHHQDIVRIIPALNLTEEQGLQFVRALDEVLAECGKIAGPMWDLGRNLMKHSLENK